MVLYQIALVLGALLKIVSVWFFVTALLFWKKPKPYARRAPETRFACLIPARNEAAVVGALVRSLREQRYPRALFDIYVIPNNCTDDTENAALAAGAKILHCSGPVRCKGDALHQAVEQLLSMDYDAFCVFDADNVAHPEFLARMNDAFCAGARVAKAALRAKNPGDSWVAGCYALYFTLNDTFFSRSRANLGLSAKLVGTGFAVRREVLAEMGGWNTVTIAEDAEFSAMCAARGERICWVPEAVTYDEAPRSFRVSLTQRRRWCSGIMSAAEAQLPALARALPGTNRARALDAILFLCLPFVQVLGVLPGLLLAADAALRGTLGACLSLLPLILAGGWAAMALAGAALAVIAAYHDWRMVRCVLLFPLFMASWLPLQVVSLLRRTTSWKEIRHSRVVAVQELLKLQ